MLKENGIITRADETTAWVKTTRSGACGSCATKKSCHTANSIREHTFTVQNTLNVKKGDYVVIGLQTRPMIFLSFLTYVLPVLLLIAGAIIGNSIAPIFQFNSSAASMVVGFSFFALAFYIIRKLHPSLSQNTAYKPFLLRKRLQTIPSSCSSL